jgi:hypothetical protein
VPPTGSFNAEARANPYWAEWSLATTAAIATRGDVEIVLVFHISLPRLEWCIRVHFFPQTTCKVFLPFETTSYDRQNR